MGFFRVINGLSNGRFLSGNFDSSIEKCDFGCVTFNLPNHFYFFLGIRRFMRDTCVSASSNRDNSALDKTGVRESKFLTLAPVDKVPVVFSFWPRMMVR